MEYGWKTNTGQIDSTAGLRQKAPSRVDIGLANTEWESLGY